jgi:hypothetical protein
VPEVRTLLDGLRQKAGFYLSQPVYDHALDLAGESPPGDAAGRRRRALKRPADIGGSRSRPALRQRPSSLDRLAPDSAVGLPRPARRSRGRRYGTGADHAPRRAGWRPVS